MKVDLHCHSNVSDGLLPPAEVARRAADRGVELLALTDHDDVAGLAEARAAFEARGLRFLDGSEISVSWRDDASFHVVGLGIDPANRELFEGLKSIRGGRDGRAHRIADELEKIGIHGAYEGAARYAEKASIISRAHFARFLVERKISPDVKRVFDHYLAKDKPGYVPHEWASVEDALRWIGDAGGVAVLAHPLRYRVGRDELRVFLGEFRDLGGQGIEVRRADGRRAVGRQVVGPGRVEGDQDDVGLGHAAARPEPFDARARGPAGAEKEPGRGARREEQDGGRQSPDREAFLIVHARGAKIAVQDRFFNSAS